MGSEGLGQMTHVGYDDISGQLRSALDQYSRVTLVRFAWVAGLLVLYILVLGPVDFFGLHRLGRPQWTWGTFPLIVIAFCLLAIWLSQRWKGSRVAVNQLDVVDVELEQGHGPGHDVGQRLQSASRPPGRGLGATPGHLRRATAGRVAVVERSAWFRPGGHEHDRVGGRAEGRVRDSIRWRGGKPATSRRGRTPHPDIGHQGVDSALVDHRDRTEAQQSASG